MCCTHASIEPFLLQASKGSESVSQSRDAFRKPRGKWEDHRVRVNMWVICSLARELYSLEQYCAAAQCGREGSNSVGSANSLHSKLASQPASQYGSSVLPAFIYKRASINSM